LLMYAPNSPTLALPSSSCLSLKDPTGLMLRFHLSLAGIRGWVSTPCVAAPGGRWCTWLCIPGCFAEHGACTDGTGRPDHAGSQSRWAAHDSAAAVRRICRLCPDAAGSQPAAASAPAGPRAVPAADAADACSPGPPSDGADDADGARPSLQ
jgi:hypothetical protein